MLDGDVLDRVLAGRLARGLSHGRIYSREGELVASVAQEGMVRPLGPR